MKRINCKNHLSPAGPTSLFAALVLMSAISSQAQIVGNVNASLWQAAAETGTAKANVYWAAGEDFNGQGSPALTTGETVGGTPNGGAYLIYGNPSSSSYLGTPDAKFTTTALAYNPNGYGETPYNPPANGGTPPATLAAFFNNPTFTSTSSGFQPNASLQVLGQDFYTYFTGEMHLNAGVNTFIITHDDGYDLNVGGGAGDPGTVTDGSTFISDSGLYSGPNYGNYTSSGTGAGAVNPGGSSGHIDEFTLDASVAGDYSFELSYANCYYYPEELNVSVDPVPDGATTIGLLGVSLGALGAFGRRIKK
jgi:hypothetical protein